MHIENIRCLEEKLAELSKEYLGRGAENVDTHELGEMIDMIKDLASAEKDARIAISMEEYDSGESNYRMGYDRYRYSNGQFAPKGKGSRMGYMPYLHMDDWGGEDMIDYPELYMNRRMGYTGEHMRHENEGSRYGRSYDKYNENRRYYTESHSPEYQQKMKDSISEIFSDTENIVMDVARDMSPEEKQKYRQKLSQLAQKLQ